MGLPNLSASAGGGSSGGIGGPVNVNGSTNYGLPWWVVVVIVAAALVGFIFWKKK